MKIYLYYTIYRNFVSRLIWGRAVNITVVFIVFINNTFPSLTLGLTVISLNFFDDKDNPSLASFFLQLLAFFPSSEGLLPIVVGTGLLTPPPLILIIYLLPGRFEAGRFEIYEAG